MINEELQEKEILNSQEVSKLIGVRVSTIRYWVIAGKIPYIKFGESGSSTVRFRRKELLDWMKKHSYKPKN